MKFLRIAPSASSPASSAIHSLRRRRLLAALPSLQSCVVSLPKKAVLAMLRLYRATRFLRTPSCRFYPSCSQYMEGCVERHGVPKGFVLTVLRLAKCHPLHPGGVDKVPSRFTLSFSQQRLHSKLLEPHT